MVWSCIVWLSFILICIVSYYSMYKSTFFFSKCPEFCSCVICVLKKCLIFMLLLCWKGEIRHFVIFIYSDKILLVVSVKVVGDHLKVMLMLFYCNLGDSWPSSCFSSWCLYGMVFSLGNFIDCFVMMWSTCNFFLNSYSP